MASEEKGERGGGAGGGNGGGGGRGRGVEGREKAADGGKMAPDAGAAIPAPVEMNLLLREMARALQGIVDERKENMDHFLRVIEATPEQEAKIRAIARGNAEKREGKALGEPSRDERLTTWRKMMDVLTPEQRAKAIRERSGK